MFIAVAERDPRLPYALSKRSVNHATPNDATEGNAADRTVAQLREPGRRIADRMEASMNSDPERLAADDVATAPPANTRASLNCIDRDALDGCRTWPPALHGLSRSLPLPTLPIRIPMKAVPGIPMLRPTAGCSQGSLDGVRIDMCTATRYVHS